MASEKRCGVCRWFAIPENPDLYNGDCTWAAPIPLPWVWVPLRPFEGAGADCPCFEPKEAGK